MTVIEKAIKTLREDVEALRKEGTIDEFVDARLHNDLDELEVVLVSSFKK